MQVFVILIELQGHRDIEKVKLQVVYLGKFVSDKAQTLCGCDMVGTFWATVRFQE